jgi:squalene-hopene/tetraprenyl-beta-curcumene cyclase
VLRLAVILVFPLLAQSVEIESSEPVVSDSLRREARAAVDRSCAWLIKIQNEDGHWSSREFPALTALPVWGLVLAGRGESASVTNGTGYILSCARDDGSIWQEPSEMRKGGGLSNYNTALCMVALHAADKEKFAKEVLNARHYLSRLQHGGRDEFRGGMGYDADSGRPYADLSNSYVAYEAMKLTADLKKIENENKSADLDWDAARAFVESLQNKDGGFIYKPGHSMAGADTNKTGEVIFRSYGSMTYAGLLSLIYADVDKEDPRVKSAFDGAAKHWTLKENPGMGLEGLFYFYNVLTKALAVYGEDTLLLPGGKEINWRSEIIRKIVNLQRIDPSDGSGYWANEASRWMEADPVLVTSYALISLLVALGE